jgi:LPXTG-site transpeptidase (sortase) family protein
MVNRNHLSALLMTTGTLLIVAALVVFGLYWRQVSQDDGNSSLATILAFGDPISTPTAGPSPTPSSLFPPGSKSPITRLIIENAKIDAPVVEKGVDDAGVMQAPDNAYDTAWYDFSAHPGFGGNAVFAGHVDYIHVGEAVFWNLKDLEPGDVIKVQLLDGTTYYYSVNFKQQFEADSAPVNQIVGPTPTESVTLITCGGTFNSATHQYDKRLVVRAVRYDPNAPAPAAHPTSGIGQTR